MFAWLQNIYASYHSIVADVQVILDDLTSIKRSGFILLSQSKDDAMKLSILRHLNQVIDSELALRRYKQSERRIQHTFVIAVVSVVSGVLGIIIIKLLS